MTAFLTPELLTVIATRHDRSIPSLVGWLAATLATGAVGALGSLDAPVFYQQLSRPPWAPPAWVFGPVWTVLYFLMGFAAWLVWRRRRVANVGYPIAFFVAQLVLNALWSWLFFAWRMGGASLAEIVVLWVTILATIISFWRVSRPAAALLLPYLAWVTFATALTASLWQRNPQLL